MTKKQHAYLCKLVASDDMPMKNRNIVQGHINKHEDPNDQFYISPQQASKLIEQSKKSIAENKKSPSPTPPQNNQQFQDDPFNYQTDDLPF